MRVSKYCIGNGMCVSGYGTKNCGFECAQKCAQGDKVSVDEDGTFLLGLDFFRALFILEIPL